MKTVQYPYKVLVGFTSDQQAALLRAATLHRVAINQVIRQYVQAGLDADSISATPPPPINGQISIDIDPEA